MNQYLGLEEMQPNVARDRVEKAQSDLDDAIRVGASPDELRRLRTALAALHAAVMTEEYLTVWEVAARLKLAPKTVRNRMHDGTVANPLCLSQWGVGRKGDRGAR
jgi:hypothetical protein